jgi:hypothetical protein
LAYVNPYVERQKNDATDVGPSGDAIERSCSTAAQNCNSVQIATISDK